MMNVTEIKGYKWLLSQGYSPHDIVFHARRSPDFITADKNGFEIKRLYGKQIRFGASQFEDLILFGGVKVVVFSDDNDVPEEILEMSELENRVVHMGMEVRVMTNGVGGTTTATLKRITKDRLDRIGNKGESYDDVINRAIDGYLRYLA